MLTVRVVCVLFIFYTNYNYQFSKWGGQTPIGWMQLEKICALREE